MDDAGSESGPAVGAGGVDRNAGRRESLPFVGTRLPERGPPSGHFPFGAHPPHRDDVRRLDQNDPSVVEAEDRARTVAAPGILRPRPPRVRGDVEELDRWALGQPGDRVAHDEGVAGNSQAADERVWWGGELTPRVRGHRVFPQMGGGDRATHALVVEREDVGLVADHDQLARIEPERRHRQRAPAIGANVVRPCAVLDRQCRTWPADAVPAGEEQDLGAGPGGQCLEPRGVRRASSSQPASASPSAPASTVRRVIHRVPIASIEEGRRCGVNRSLTSG